MALTSCVTKLVPFFVTFVLFFMYVEDKKVEGNIGFFQVLLKCSPIFSLILFVHLTNGSSELSNNAKKIMAGLFFSAIGDAFLLFPENYFLHGTGAFALAQIMYISKFGFTHVKFGSAAPMFLLTFGALAFLVPGLYEIGGPLLSAVVPIYCSLLTTTMITAVFTAKANCHDWAAIAGAAGAISFVLSDTVLAFNEFFSPIPNADFIIMVTYYLAQLGITVSLFSGCCSQKQVNKKSKNSPKKKVK